MSHRRVLESAAPAEASWREHHPARRRARRAAVLVAVLAAAGLTAAGARAYASRLTLNRACCQLAWPANLRVSLAELLGVGPYVAEIGQDKWVLEHVFPDVRDGYFVDVGSGHGTIGSNTRALEERGWTGLCIDPFPIEMQGRTCRVVRAVVFERPGVPMTFHLAGGLGGLSSTLAPWNTTAARAPTVTFTTRTLRDILAEAGAPSFIHYLSLDIEGAEFAALQAFPFEHVRLGAVTVEHNREEPKRSRIRDLLAAHGYALAHSYRQEDFYRRQPGN